MDASGGDGSGVTEPLPDRTSSPMSGAITHDADVPATGAGASAGAGAASGNGAAHGAAAMDAASDGGSGGSPSDRPVLVDCHAHLTDEALRGDLDAVLARAREAGVRTIVCVSQTFEDAKRVLALADKYPDLVRPCIGLHPLQDGWNSVRASDLPPMLALIRENAKRLAGVGEVGLDFSPMCLKTGDAEVIKAEQREVLRAQAELALELGLPLNVHSRAAGHHAITLLKEVGAANSCVMHAFDGKAKYAVDASRHGFKFSIPPCVVRSPQMQKLVRLLPLEHMCLETDSPALPAVKGERNEPAQLSTSQREIARIKAVEPGVVAASTTKVAQALFRMQPERR